MPPDAILKIGGSLGRGDGLRRLCREITRLGERHSLLVVPGGGMFADLVRKSYREYKLGETAAHSMALLAMDQYGYLLSHLIENSALATDPASAVRISMPAHVPVLLPSASVLHDRRLPHSWDVTSDTIAAWVAYETGCRKLVLLKDVEGLNSSDTTRGHQPIREMTVQQLTKHAGGVDAYLAGFLSFKNLETWIINGLKPERIRELLDSGSTAGTRIAPDFRQGSKSF
jgi:aspartokinase-like uncharacterized kinase